MNEEAAPNDRERFWQWCQREQEESDRKIEKALQPVIEELLGVKEQPCK